MKKITLGILAHVDSGKTTLSEAMLYTTGVIRNLGRVDKKNTFLDTDAIERDRGITIFSKQAVMEMDNMTITLIDTPGHSDFGAEAERTLAVLDYAIVIVSASDKVTSHTETLWNLLRRYDIPVFVFVNKTDLPYDGKEVVFDALKKSFGEGFCEFGKKEEEDFFEEISMYDENVMQEFLDVGKVSDETISSAILERHIYPCIFGSALRVDGIDTLLECISRYTAHMEYPRDFGAKVYKITEDDSKNRLTFLKITGGSISVKSLLSGETPDGNKWEEKINQIRVYSGDKYITKDVAEAGDVCAFTGLSATYAGEGLGCEEDSMLPVLESVFSYKAVPEDGVDIHYAIDCFKKLSEQDGALKCRFDLSTKEIHLNIMGEIQMDVLKKVVSERYGFEVEFYESGVLYKETIAEPVEGVGHYEPLRHYAEVHLLLEPGERGSGLVFDTKCGEDMLDRHFQRLILTHLNEKTHVGPLTGSPITDMKITLYSAKAHNKHTEGGDFRQATYRAVRHGLRCGQSLLLEPWYDFTLYLPSNHAGRAMTDISNMGGRFSPPEVSSDMSIIKGSAPVMKLRSYQRDVAGYTKGAGRLSLAFCGYEECTDSDAVIQNMGYNPDSDVENTADSVFCSHGAGFVVKWDKVTEYMHLDSIMNKKEEDLSCDLNIREVNLSDSVENEAEILKIYENTYGKIKKKTDGIRIQKKKFSSPKPPVFKGKTKKYDGEYLLIDGYNIIFAWEDLKMVAQESLELARKLLVDRISNFASVKNDKVIIVFDAYKVKGGRGSVEQEGNVTVVYTKEAETADTYIEKVSHTLSKNNLVRVATSDGMEQIIIVGNGAFRISAENFLKEVIMAEEEIQRILRMEE